MISLVVAASENNVIGKNNGLLWHLPNDMKFFKNTTWGMPVIMGRKTFESMKGPLKGRTNIVVTHQAGWKKDGAIVVNDLKDAYKAAKETDAKEAFVIGGGEIYRQSFPEADRIYLTRVHATLEGDTWFPEIAKENWDLVSQLDFNADEKHAYSYSFQVWDKKKQPTDS